MRLTIGDYFYRLPGLIENISITIDDNSPWEIESNDTFKQLPHVINVQCAFKPIHDFLPRREKYSSMLDSEGFTKSNYNDLNVPFITDDKSDYVNADILDTTLKINQPFNFKQSDEDINNAFLNDLPTINPNINVEQADREINARFNRTAPVGRVRTVIRTNTKNLMPDKDGVLKDYTNLLSQQPYDPPYTPRPR
jgi:hypothetical protein